LGLRHFGRGVAELPEHLRCRRAVYAVAFADLRAARAAEAFVERDYRARALAVDSLRRLGRGRGLHGGRLPAFFITLNSRVRRLGLVNLPSAVCRSQLFRVRARAVARLQAEECERARFEPVAPAALDRASRLAPAEALARVEQLLPDDAAPVRRQPEGDGAVVRVQQEQQRVVVDAV